MRACTVASAAGASWTANRVASRRAATHLAARTTRSHHTSLPSCAAGHTATRDTQVCIGTTTAIDIGSSRGTDATGTYTHAADGTGHTASAAVGGTRRTGAGMIVEIAVVGAAHIRA